MTSISLHIRDGFDEFEDEPEDELASRGMHVVESDEDEEEKPVEEEDGVEAVVAAEVPVEEKKEEEEKEVEYKDGLAELEDMERTYVESSAPSFGGADDPEEV